MNGLVTDDSSDSIADGCDMATLTIRGLDDETRSRLRVRAARNGRSMEAEARSILLDALSDASESVGLATWIRAQLDELGIDGVDLDIPPRGEMPPPAISFDE